MNSREASDMPPAPSYPSPNAAQIGQGTMHYYNRQLTTDELLSAELSRETAGGNLADGSSNGIHHGQSLVLDPSNAGASDMGRASSEDQQHNTTFGFPPNQQVGVDPNHDLSYGDQSARRKRSKVSRACDECRRKKVRCDATSESGVETCSNCRRLGVVCQFSRVPMKRGPSKGYIKELAERLNTLESQMQPPMGQQDMQYQPMNDVTSPRDYQEFSPPMDGNLLGRKRTYSMLEGLHGSAFPQASFASRVQQPSVGETATTNPESYPLFSENLSMHRISDPFWSGPQRSGAAIPDQAEPELGAVSQPATDDTVPVHVDEGALNVYYEKIHPVLPILPQTTDQFLQILHKCNKFLQEVLLYGLYTVTHTDFGRVQGSFQNVTSMSDALELLDGHLRDPHGLRTTSVNLVWLQAIFFIILDCDARGPEKLYGKNGVSKSVLVEAASKLSYDLARKFDRLQVRNAALEDNDSEPGLARRGWVVSSILARWHTISMAERDLIGVDHQDVGVPSDVMLVGFAPCQLAAYSSLLSPLSDTIMAEDEANKMSPGIKRAVRSTLVHLLTRLLDVEGSYIGREEVNGAAGFLEGLGPQVYWTVNLILSRELYVTSPYEVLHAAEAVVKEMHKDVAAPRLPSPIDLHSLSLATLSLLEGSQMPLYSGFCWEVLGKIEQILDLRENATSQAGEFENIFATPHWDRLIRSWIEKKRSLQNDGESGGAVGGAGAGGGGGQTSSLPNPSNAPPPILGPNEQRSLQHLADLAVGAEGVAAAAASPSSPPPSGGNMNFDAGAGAGASASSSSLSTFVDFTLALKKGYLRVISRGPTFRH